MMNQEGIVLLMTILILSLLSLLVLFEMQHIFLYYKGLNQIIEKRQNFYTLELGAQKLALQSWQYGQSCIRPEKDSKEIMHLLTTEACSFKEKNQVFLYLVEDLGEFPCLQSLLNKRHYSTHHWRINVLMQKTGARLLQWRIARPIALLPCLNKPNNIPLGLLSWRYLENN
ncbi:hypothetical protein [Legionella cardiaca]|uniref:Tfp pilus assembly protein PilX n=1 Tax=Legionella cardiaca TaxID=1071983 RepID=A0ABY8AS75_9GAMM|nr:hypothetical protein [Legionella cardiaca]WED42042.1 hypothetical protein PXX05_08860 [Legionella cardiaca]